MRVIFYFLLISIGFYSCYSNSGEQPPENLIPEDQMINVLAEIELTQAFIKLNIAAVDSINQPQLFQNIFDKHNTTRNSFNESLIFYSKQPQVLESIYQKVITSLSEQQATTQIK
jgi:Domain of unknown function (DUF4296)